MNIVVIFHESEKHFADRLRVHTAPFRRSFGVTYTEVAVKDGDPAPDTGDLCLGLLTPDFLAWWLDSGLEDWLGEAQAQQRVGFFPIWIKKSDIKDTKLAYSTPVPRDKPLVEKGDADAAWVEVAAELRKYTEKIIRDIMER